MKKLYVNENFPMPVVHILRKLGYDVLTSLEAGNANLRIPDPDVLAFATEQNRILLTINRRDFIRLHLANSDHSGIVVCTMNPDFEDFAQRIHEELLNHEDTCTGQLIRIYKPA